MVYDDNNDADRFNPAAVGPLSCLAAAIREVRAYSLARDRTMCQEEFASVALDDYEGMMISHLSCVTAPEDDEVRDAFLRDNGLEHLIPEMHRASAALLRDLDDDERLAQKCRK